MATQMGWAQTTVKVGVQSIIASSYENWTAETPCTQIESFDSEYANRGTVELVLLCQAFEAAGMDVELDLVTYPNYERAKAEVFNGNIHLFAETLWEPDIDTTAVYKTQPVIKKGEYEKGIYTSPENEELLGITNFGELQNYSAVIPKVWSIDLDALNRLDLKAIHNSPEKDLLYRIIDSGRADFTILEFSSRNDLSREHNNIRLVPVPGLKISLKEARHWAVSKEMSETEKIYNTLEKGISILRERGVIQKAFKESGFFNQQVADWKEF